MMVVFGFLGWFLMMVGLSDLLWLKFGLVLVVNV